VITLVSGYCRNATSGATSALSQKRTLKLSRHQIAGTAGHEILDIGEQLIHQSLLRLVEGV
jgi:hypothetical protein